MVIKIDFFSVLFAAIPLVLLVQFGKRLIEEDRRIHRKQDEFDQKIGEMRARVYRSYRGEEQPSYPSRRNGLRVVKQDE